MRVGRGRWVGKREGEEEGGRRREMGRRGGADRGGCLAALLPAVRCCRRRRWVGGSGRVMRNG